MNSDFRKIVAQKEIFRRRTKHQQAVSSLILYGLSLSMRSRRISPMMSWKTAEQTSHSRHCISGDERQSTSFTMCQQVFRSPVSIRPDHIQLFAFANCQPFPAGLLCYGLAMPLQSTLITAKRLFDTHCFYSISHGFYLIIAMKSYVGKVFYRCLGFKRITGKA